MPKNAKKEVYKEKEFEMYVLWKSLPAYFRGMKKEQLHSHGFTDPLIMKIATIQSQTAFAKKFRIKDLGTLTDWNARIKKNKLDTNISYSSMQKQTTALTSALSTPPDTLLKIELHEQRKLLTALKKENRLLKKQFSITTKKIPIKIKLDLTPTTQVVITPAEPKKIERVSFFKKALSFLKNEK